MDSRVGKRLWMFAGALLAAATGVAAAIAASPSGPGEISAEQQRLADAKAQSAAAQRRSAALDQAASAERGAAAKARAKEAAVLARVQQAQADIAAAEARIVIVGRLLDSQRGDLARQQGPIVRLIAVLQSLASRPAVISVVQPGSIDDLVHVRAVLGTELPVVRARTSAVRAALTETRKLNADAVLAVGSLRESRARLDTQRLALARLEARHQRNSRSLGRDALFESDRAIAMGERARDIVDLMDQLGDAAQVRAELSSLPGPVPRPPAAGEIASPVDVTAWPRGYPPYRLPVSGKVITGLGELSDAGVRSRGLTIETAPGAGVVAPAAGRIAYAGRFRDYGTIVIIDHGGGWTTLVAHLASASVKVGEAVAQGDSVGEAGDGDSPRVTIELRRKDRPIDMTPLLG